MYQIIFWIGPIEEYCKKRMFDLFIASLRTWHEPCMLSDVILARKILVHIVILGGRKSGNFSIYIFQKYGELLTSNRNCSFLIVKTSDWCFWTFGRGQISPCVLIVIWAGWKVEDYLSLLNPGTRTIMTLKAFGSLFCMLTQRVWMQYWEPLQAEWRGRSNSSPFCNFKFGAFGNFLFW